MVRIVRIIPEASDLAAESCIITYSVRKRLVSSRFLAWYLGGLLGLACILLSLISVVPDAESKRVVAQCICVVGAVLFAGLGLTCGWLSPQHWVNRSAILRSVLGVLAIGLTLFLLVGVIG
jgi:hypothetical protein